MLGRVAVPGLRTAFRAPQIPTRCHVPNVIKHVPYWGRYADAVCAIRNAMQRIVQSGAEYVPHVAGHFAGAAKKKKNRKRKEQQMKIRNWILGVGVACAMSVGASTNASIVSGVGDTLSLSSGTLPSDYSGFTWDGTWTYTDLGGTTGYVVAGGDASSVLRSDTQLFTFGGATFRSTGDAATVTVTGFDASGNTVNWQTYDLSAGEVLDASGLSGTFKSLVFTGSGWEMNNFSDAPVIPEPTTMLAGALLLLPFGASTMRSVRKKAKA